MYIVAAIVFALILISALLFIASNLMQGASNDWRKDIK